MTWQEQREKICALNARCIKQVEEWLDYELTEGRTMELKPVVDKETGRRDSGLQDAVDLLAKCSTIARQWIEKESGESGGVKSMSDESLARKGKI